MICNRCKKIVFEENCTFVNLMIYHKRCANEELTEELRELIPLILKDIRKDPGENYQNHALYGSLAPYFKNYFNLKT